MKKIMILYGFLLFSFVSAQNNSEKIDSLFELVNTQKLEISNLNNQHKSSVDQLTSKIQLLEDNIEALSKVNTTDKKAINNRININEKSISNFDSKIDAKVKALNNQLDQQQKNLNTNQEGLKENSEEIISVKSLLDEKSLQITSITSSLEEKGVEITDIKSEISKKQLLWMIIILFILMLSIIAYLLLSKRMASDKKDIHEKIIENDQKLADFLEGFTKDLKVSDKEENHEVAIKTASELTKMGNNLNMMDSSIRGHKHLLRSKQKIEDYLKINGYEIKTYLNQEYNEDMNIIANFVEDESLEKGERIITKCIKPQINYNGKMIQMAEVEVSQGV